MKQLTLFLIYILFSIPGQAQNENLSKKELREIVDEYFIIKEVPIRYYSNILIRLDGNPTREDSIYVQQLVDTLNTFISIWDVYLIPEGTSNLILEINKHDGETYPRIRLGNRENQEIILTTQPVNFPNDLSELERKKTLYYNLLRSLVIYHHTPELVEKLPGTVFTVLKSSEVTFNPVDFQIIAGIYSSEYDNELKQTNQFVAPSRNNNQAFIIATLVSTLLSGLFLLWMFLLGLFKRHGYVFSEYIKQGAIVLCAFLIGILVGILIPIISNYPRIYSGTNQIFISMIGLTIGSLIIGSLSIIILYLLERKILKDNQSLALHVIFPFLTTTVIPATLLFFIVLYFSS